MVRRTWTWLAALAMASAAGGCDGGETTGTGASGGTGGDGGSGGQTTTSSATTTQTGGGGSGGSMAECGNGAVESDEDCDDGNTGAADGCAADCKAVDDGYVCVGEPSACATVCGDGVIAGAETCDDSNAAAGDGCSDACAVETGYLCVGAPSVCGAICGDGLIVGGETCDDGNIAGNDGCSPTCTIQTGYTCTGQPSVCATVCGDGLIVGAETCDDGNAAPEDGCSATCQPETGYLCSGMPSACNPICADGLIVGNETCDDANLIPGDGCSGACLTETGWTCAGQPSACSEICGDALVVGTEGCDDGNLNPGDGCDPVCDVEAGYACTGSPSICASVCGDGVKTPDEECDDGNILDGDCCSSTCTLTSGCEAEPNNNCSSVNPMPAMSGTPLKTQISGFITPAADKDYFSFDIPGTQPVSIRLETWFGTPGTCTSTSINDTRIIYRGLDCNAELVNDSDDGVGWCSLVFGGAPTNDVAARNVLPGTHYANVEHHGTTGTTALYTLVVDVVATCGNGILETPFEVCDDGNNLNGDGCEFNCVLSCGNGVVDAGEACDDGNLAANDGCTSTCTVEPGFTCAGAPSVCTAICGDGQIKTGEQCDDGNPSAGDGCSATCQVEPNYICNGTPSTCAQFEVFCNDGVDNDGDGATDSADPDCQIPAYFPACGAGEQLRVYLSPNTAPIPIPDSNLTGITSTITAGNGGTIERVAVLFNITHTFDADLDIYLTGPTGGQLDICTDNGSSGDNFVNTVLDSTCATPVTSGTAPFTGCYSPETSLATFNGQSPDGPWTLKVADDAGSDLGTLNNWRLLMCVTP